jgi:DNA-directed RNA polymerase specialized sigma24 family protein
LSERETRGSLDALRRLSDEELARTAAAGDEGAARVLLERFEEPLYRYTLALVRDTDLAQEATWSALFEAARAVRMDEYSEPIKPWLFRVAHTAADVAGGRPNGIVESDEAAARAAAAGDEDRERLEALLAGLDELPAREQGSLLLRELVGLEYTGIATVTGARAPEARQSVFQARLALQGNPEPPTDHCDEIRAAMSKAEIGVRERRSIASHLEGCPVCEEFARQLETRAADLRTLFPAPEEPLAAELVPPLPPVPAGAGQREAEAEAGAAGVGIGAGVGAGAGAASAAASAPVGEPPDRGRRRALVALALAVLLVGAGIATALALNDNGGGDKGKARAARETSTTLTAPSHTTPAEEGKKPAGEGKKPAEESKKPTEESKTPPEEKPAKPKESEKPKAAAGGAANGGSSTSGEGSKRGSAGAGGSTGAGGSAAQGGSSEGGAASGGGSEQGGGSKSASGEASAAGVPRTGLDVSLVIVLGLLMLALGISLRRAYAEL